MSQKFHSTKSLKPLVEDDRPKPQTPKLHKPQKPPITTAKPIDEVHWITKPNSAMHRVELPESREARDVTIDTSDASGKLPEPDAPASTPDAAAEVEPESKIEHDSHWMPETSDQEAVGQDSKAPDIPDSPPQVTAPTEPHQIPPSTNQTQPGSPAAAGEQPASRQAKPKLWIGLFLGIVALAGLSFGGWFIFLKKEKPRAPTLITTPAVSQLKAEAAIIDGSVERQQGESWIAIDQGQTLQANDVVRTGESSRAVFNFDDGSALRLDQLTQVTIAQLDSQGIVVDQSAGRSYHRVEPGTNYQVTSIESTASALGTSFATTTDAQGQKTAVVVTESKVKVKAAGVSDEVTIDQGQTGQINHTDKTIDVSQTDPALLEQDFYAWNNALNTGSEYAKPTPTPEPTAAPEVQPTSNTTVEALGLNATAVPGGVKLQWNLTGVAPDGFKVLWSTQANPSFPTRQGDSATAVSEGTRHYTVSGLQADQTYHFRVAVYNGKGGTRWYSNNVSLQPLAKFKPTPKPTVPAYTGTITLSGSTPAAGKISLTWSPSTTEHLEGFKVVYATTPNPTYPGSQSVFVNAATNAHQLTGLQSGQTYYIRVGAYQNGKVSSYSNLVTLNVP